MSKKPIILGIESSCDETAASIITENEEREPTILANIISSQVDVHKEFGGVVPELAARSHVEKIDWITEKAIKDSGIKIRGYRCHSFNGRSRFNCLPFSRFKFWKNTGIIIKKTFCCCKSFRRTCAKSKT